MNDALFFLLAGRRRGVIGPRRPGRAVPPGVGPEGVRHQSEGRGPSQAVALHVWRDGEGLRVGDEGPGSLLPSQPGQAL